MSFLRNSLTRKFIVQAIYYSFFVDDLSVHELLTEEDLFFNIPNPALFASVVSFVFQSNEKYPDIFNAISFDPGQLSIVAVSVFKAFVAELMMSKLDYNILFKEYLKLSNVFCYEETSSIKSFMQQASDFIKANANDSLTIDSFGDI